MSKTVKDLITMSFLVGIGLAVLANPNGAVTLIQTVSSSWFRLIGASSGHRQV